MEQERSNSQYHKYPPPAYPLTIIKRSSSQEKSNPNISSNVPLSFRPKSPIITTSTFENNQRENKKLEDNKDSIFKRISNPQQNPMSLTKETSFESKQAESEKKMRIEQPNQNSNKEIMNEENKKSNIQNLKQDNSFANNSKTIKDNSEVAKINSKLMRKFEKGKSKQIEAISQIEPITPLKVFKILQEGFQPDKFRKKQSDALLAIENVSKCLHCEFKGNPDCQSVFCPEEQYWLKKNGSTVHARKTYVLYSFENESFKKMLSNAVFIFFVKRVQFDMKHKLMFVHLKTQIAGGFWDIFAQTTDLKFKAASWDEGFSGITCPEVILHEYKMDFKLGQEAHSIVTKTFSSAGRNSHNYYHNSPKENEKSLSKLEISQPKDISGGKRSLDSFNECSKSSEDPLPQKKVKGTSENTLKKDNNLFEEPNYEELSDNAPKKFARRSKNLVSDNKKLKQTNGMKDYLEFFRSKLEKLGKLPDPENDDDNDYTIKTLIKQHRIITMDGIMDFCFRLIADKLDLIAYVTKNAESIYKNEIEKEIQKNNSLPKSFEEFMTKQSKISETRMNDVFESSKTLYSLQRYFGKNNNNFMEENDDSGSSKSLSTKSSESEDDSDQISAENGETNAMEIETEDYSKNIDSEKTFFGTKKENSNEESNIGGKMSQMSFGPIYDNR